MGKLITQNRRVRRNYAIDRTLEAGIVLTGSEVKSLRAGNANLNDGYANVEKGEVYLYSMHIAPYSHATDTNHEPRRRRKLLLNKHEINKIESKIKERGFSLIPTRLYFNDRGIAKIELALARGKKKYDKREAIERDRSKRELQAAKKRTK